MTVEYRWHPFHGRRFHARDAGRRDGILLLVDGDPHVSRKLPEWMCDPITCGAMTKGPPMVRADALRDLSAVLAALLPDRVVGSSPDSLDKEAADETMDDTSSNATQTGPGTADTAAPRSAALVRALADLLLEALHREMIATDRKERIGELEDHV